MSGRKAPSHGGLDPNDEGETNMASFWHPKNIQSGLGRIIWAPGDFIQPDGAWVLPGGRRTTDEGEARRAADFIDNILRSAYIAA
jgi:hypothetical protein